MGGCEDQGAKVTELGDLRAISSYRGSPNQHESHGADPALTLAQVSFCLSRAVETQPWAVGRQLY